MKLEQERKLFSTFVDIFDLYGHSFNLHIFRKEKYKTLIGSIMGFLSIMLIISVAIYFIIDLFERKSMTVIFNEDFTTIPINNLTNTPLMLALGDISGQIIEPQGLYSFDVKIMKYKYIKLPDVSYRFGLELIPIQLEKCDLQKHFLDYGHMFQALNV